MAPPLPLIFLLMIPAGVYSDDRGVSYTSKYICALKGSSVIMSCTYKYPPEYKIKKVFWTKFIEKGVEYPDLFNDPEYSQRIQYLGDKQQNCTIRLNDVTQKDSHEYYFRFITDKTDGRWIGYPGVTLDITDLHVESPESVTEGDTVSLTCKSTCNLTDRATFIWLKNTQSLTERNNKLLLQSVRREDAGRYSCAVHGHKLTSPHVYLNVRYSPKNVSVSISGSGEIFLGDSVNLTCSSDSNPPVLNYTWFKENESSAVGSGQSYSALQSGFFYCVAQNQHGSQRSAAVSVTVHHRSGWYIMLGIVMGCGGTIFIIIIIIIVLFIIKRERKKRRSAMKENEHSVLRFYIKKTADRSDDTYTTLDLKNRSSDDVYNTITTDDHRYTEDTYTALVPQSRSSEYETLSVSQFHIFSILLINNKTVLIITQQEDGAVSGGAQPIKSFHHFPGMAPPLPLIFLLMIPAGVYSDDWGVSYTSKYICALKGSSVIMSCTYKYPPEYKIKKVFWTKFIEKGVEPPDLFNDSEYSQRIQYLGDKQQNCTIRLNDVTQKDSHKYYFRFITDKTGGRWIGYPGVNLDITDLHVESPEIVTEGDTVSLTCKSTCNLTDRATFIWLKNTQSLTERNNKLLLQSVRREDAGRYSCAVHGHKLTSPHVYLNVRYSPKTVSVSMSGSGEIVLGDSVTLTCSSDSNPPVLNYTWFKENTTVGSGEIYSITSIHSDDSGEYKCMSRNEVGEKYSDTVTLNVMYAPKTVSVSMSGSGEIVLGDSVTLTCSSDSNPPVLNYTWFKENETSSVGSGQSYSALQSGFFYCVAQNQHGSQRSAAVSVTVRYRFGWHVVLGITVGCGGLLIIIIIIIIIILFKMKKRAGVKNENLSVNQDRIYSDVIERVSVHDAPLSESETADHNDAQYSSITPKRLRGNLTAGKTLESTAEIEYATVQHHKNKKMKRTEEHESQNDRRSDMLTVEEASVIYSSVR
ncbi:uncharacterized protein LOC127444811 [Myxocyprinus asiaticus]|uniref:uncharacterized protein LOC127444811 n=1 Tax=Myxocyprinus asiaticus TaxID=70543 RepID=UPI002222FC42|nr:uncharacterized protein LOC127444811 [Myxocyprinus asiaticus]